MLPIAPEKVFKVPVICKVPSFALAPSMVPAMVTELFSAKIILASPVLSSKVIPDELVTALLKVTYCLHLYDYLHITVMVGIVTASANNAAPALAMQFQLLRCRLQLYLKSNVCWCSIAAIINLIISSPSCYQ